VRAGCRRHLISQSFGGTELNLDASGNRAGRDTVWNDTYNRATNNLVFGDDGPNPLATGGSRGIPDISMSGSCTAAVNVYQSFGGLQAGWYPVCGTSESAPMFAGIVMVTSGNNTVSFPQGGKRTRCTVTTPGTASASLLESAPSTRITSSRAGQTGLNVPKHPDV
jgi:hypothetical protein